MGCRPTIARCARRPIGIAYDRGGPPGLRPQVPDPIRRDAGTGRIDIDPYFLGTTLYELGELYESAGDVKHALEYYGRFIDLWKNADPELQPRVASARARMAQLNRAKG